MISTETEKNIIITHGPTSLLVRKDMTSLTSRGSSIVFNTAEDLLAFSNEFAIIMVELTQKTHELTEDLVATKGKETPGT